MEESGYCVRPDLVIPEREVWFEFDHARGPGGQHVNKAATGAVLNFHVDGSGVLTDWQKRRISQRLANRISSEGILRVACRNQRSQSANRRLASERFCLLLALALARPKPRHATRPTFASRKRRLSDKRFKSLRKASRKPPEDA